MNSQLCSSFKPLCVFELQMWMLTEGSVHKLQDCRDGSSPIGSGTAQAFCVVHHLHCSFSHSKETGGALSLCFVAGDHLKVHPQARACAFYSIWQPQRFSQICCFKGVLSWPFWDSKERIQIEFSFFQLVLKTIGFRVINSILISVKTAGFSLSYWELIAAMKRMYVRWNQEYY